MKKLRPEKLRADFSFPKILGPITENTLPFTDLMTAGPTFREQNPAMDYWTKIPQ